MTSSNATPLRPQASRTGDDSLVYAIELWTHDHSALEQVLARAVSVTLARAIFAAARQEHPDRHIVLRHGDQVIDKS